MITASFVLMLAAATAPPAATDGRITFGTKSEPAAAAAREAMQLHVRGARPADLTAAAQRAVDADTEFALAHQLLAVGFGMQQEREASEVQLARARELSPRAPEGERRFIEAWQLKDRPDEALAAWKKLAADYPNEPLAHLTLGQLLLRRENKAEAHAALAAVLSLEPASTFALRTVAGALVESNEFAAARQKYEEAGADRFATDIALTYLLEGNRAEALARLRQHVEKNGDDLGVGAWNFVGHLQLEAGDPVAALSSYERGVAVVKASDWAENDKQVWIGRYHHGRGRCLARQGKHAEAWAEVETVKRMIDAGGEKGTVYLPAWHFLAGYAKLEAGENQAALQHLEEAGRQHDPHRTQMMALANERLGNKAAAREYYEQVVSRKALRIDAAAPYAEAKARLAALSAETAPAPAPAPSAQ